MNVTFIGAKVAEMVSDGQRFKLAMYRPQDKRRFIYGSNLTDIERMNATEIKQTNDPQLTKAGGLVNMRPQHITDSFLIKPIAENDRPNAFREEVRQVEADTRPGKKNRLVERSYYVVYVLERDHNGQLKLRRKFWFDRSQTGCPLVRQQTFENSVGRLAGDVTYSDWFTVPNSSSAWPGHVIIDRRNDGYRLDLRLVAETVEVNADLPITTFDLENTEKLEELNLDAPHKAANEAPGKPNVTSLVAVPFALLVLLVEDKWAPLLRLDNGARDTLHSFATTHAGFVSAMKRVSDSGSALAWTAVLTVVVAWLLWRRLPRLALFVVVTAASSSLLNTAVKAAVHRLRPVLTDPVAHATGLSFPSGHAQAAVVGYAVLLLVFLPILHGSWRTTAVALAVFMVLAVGFSRVALGVHYVSDVVAGYVLGSAWVAAMAAACNATLASGETSTLSDRISG
jgi:undecaprenyl-diphosphatase